MNGKTWVITAIVLGVLGLIGYRWRRHHHAGQLADTLLADVLKAKDAFRR